MSQLTSLDFYVVVVCLFFSQSCVAQAVPELTMNSQSSCLYFPSARIIGAGGGGILPHLAHDVLGANTKNPGAERTNQRQFGAGAGAGAGGGGNHYPFNKVLTFLLILFFLFLLLETRSFYVALAVFEL